MRAPTALFAMLAVLVSGCGAAPPRSDPAAPPPSATTTAPHKPARSGSAVPVPGWADDVVAAGDAAYVVGWHADESGALWRVDSAGRLAARTAPPGMPGNPGTSGGIFRLVFDGPDVGLALTGTYGDRRHRGHRALFATADGARTWNRVDLPTQEQPAQVAVGGGAAYALTSNCLTATSACDHATLWSVDPTGAVAPHAFRSLPPHSGTAGPVSVAGFGDDVWVLLDMGGGRGTALHSSNAGRTWQRFDAGLCLSEPLVATSGTVVWATCTTGMLEHFTRQVGDTAAVGVFASDVGGTSDSALIPLTDSTAIGVMQDRRRVRVEATHDGGRSTARVGSIPRRIERRDFRITFLSEGLGYLVTINGGQLYRTDDGGRLWTRIKR